MSEEHVNGHEPDYNLQVDDVKTVKDMLIGSGYSEIAVDYFLNKKAMGSLPDANQVSELTGTCGDTMKIFLKIDQDRIQDAKIQVLGCPGAIASAMAAMEMIKGNTLDQAMQVRDADVFRRLGALPDQKQHCIRLSIKTLQKAIGDYRQKNGQQQP
ncbi:MAG: iron-sulfur cluster assembly scaffold protein [Pseudomonadota bacterium]